MSILLQLLKKSVSVDNYHNDFLILKSESMVDNRKIGKAIYNQQFDFVEEVIITEVEICLKLNRNFNPSRLEELKTIKEGKVEKSKTYRLPIYFNDQEDWTTIQSFTSLGKQEIIKHLINTEFSISMFGFLPGFLYLNGLDKKLHVPRKKIPSKYVKANSIAIGGQYLGVYSLDSPGGWHVIGITPVSVLQIPKLPPIELNLEDRIVLHSISEEEYESLLQKQISLMKFNA